MRLYLCRHGIAEDPAHGQPDAERALTLEGIKKFRRAAKGFASLDPEITHILTSPLRRAAETATLLHNALAKVQKEPTLEAVPALAPPGKLKEFLATLRRLPADSAVVAVAHEPFLGSWLGELCFGRPGQAELKKGAIAALDLDDELNAARLLWLLPPALLRRL